MSAVADWAKEFQPGDIKVSPYESIDAIPARCTAIATTIVDELLE